ncbi:MAG: Uncharacterized protein XD52_1002, partial [bacterium 42_11]
MGKKVVFFFSTDKYPSPFDVLVLYDAGADVVFPCGGLEVEEVKDLVLDAMFPRGPKGILDTTIFIGGKDVSKCEKILEVTKKTMFPPFEMAVAFDPAGACTTSAAMVSKVAKVAKDKLGKSLPDITVTILAGSGAVGSRAAFLFAKDGARVIVGASRLESAQRVAEEINGKLGKEKVFPAFVPRFIEDDKGETYEACKDSDVVVSTAAPGVMKLSLELLKRLPKTKIVADVNAVPPLGIEGLRMDADGEELIPGVYAIGPLSIGNVKLQ